jgi:hypothetical protein
MRPVQFILGGVAAFFVIALPAFIIYIFKTPMNRQ